MLRTALRPRFLGLLALALLCITAFVLLGRWQLGVAQDKATRDVLRASAAQGVADLESLIRPHQAFRGELSARPVRVSGRWAPEEQVLVVDRRLDGRPGVWVVTGLRTDAGAVVPVLRGFVEDPAQIPRPATGRVVIEGGLAPGESPAPRADLPEGQLRSVDLAVLVNAWPGEAYDAFIFLQREAPAAGADPADPAALNALTTVPTPTRSAGLNWRNASYAAQWWVFAAFALWLWWRMVRDEHRRSLTPRPASPDAPTRDSSRPGRVSADPPVE